MNNLGPMGARVHNYGMLLSFKLINLILKPH